MGMKKVLNEFGILSQESINFRLTYEQKSINGAARKISQDPGNLSRSISRLESRINSKLFIRHKNGLRPTELGDRLYRALLRAQSEFMTYMGQEGNKSRKIQIGLSSTIGYTHFSSHLLKCLHEKAMHPEFHIDSSFEIIELIKARKLDFAIVHQAIRFPGLIAKKIGTEDLVLCASRSEMQRNLVVHPDMLGLERIIQSVTYENRWVIKDYFLIASFLQKDHEMMGILPEGVLTTHRSLKVLKRFSSEGKITALSWPDSIGVELMKGL